MSRHIGNKGIELIKSFEGMKLKAYKCPADVWTIGYGHTAGVKWGDVLANEKEAEGLLKMDLIIYERAVIKALKVAVTQNQYDALVSLT